MGDIILRAFSLVLMIAAGIFMRAFGIADENAAAFAKKLLMYVTLPAAIITNFSGIGHMDGGMAVLILMGIAANLIMIGAGAFLTGRKSREEEGGGEEKRWRHAGGRTAGGGGLCGEDAGVWDLP